MNHKMKKQAMQSLPKSSPRVKAAKLRYANDQSAGKLAEELMRTRGQGHFRYRGSR